MNLNKYFVIACIVFILAIFGFYTGINHSSMDKLPVLETGQEVHHHDGNKN